MHTIFAWVLAISLLPFPARAVPASQQKARPTSTAYLEIGTDSSERKFFRPRLRFDIPIASVGLYLDVDYYQRLNSRLEGEVDFWVRVGGTGRLSPSLSWEAAINHFCRHETLRDVPVVLDINELLARFWLHLPAMDVGLGGGTFLGTSSDFDTLMTANVSWPRLFGSEFSGQAALKWVDLDEIFYEFELSMALDPALDLIARYTREYAYPETTYLGLRFNSQGKAEEHIDKFNLRGSATAFDSEHKVLAEHEFKLNFFQTPKRQLLLYMSGYIPIKRGRDFFYTFHPDEVRNQIGLEYERKLRPDLHAYFYSRYNLHLPIDVAQAFDSSLGLGGGIRNQSYFKKLDRSFRYEAYLGQNFSHTFDAGLRLGLNTAGERFRIGGDAELEFGPDTTFVQLEIFGEIGRAKEVRFRPFLAFQHLGFAEGRPDASDRILLGFELLTWY
jgi:hypothetical protein